MLVLGNIKKIILVILLVLYVINTRGQNFDGGLFFGITTSQVGGDDLSGFNKAGIITGIYTVKKISEKFSIQIEMSYVEKGSNNPEMNDPKQLRYGQQDISLSYFELPLILQYNTNTIWKLESGISWGYLINGYYNDLSGPINNLDIPFSTLDIGGILGIEYKYSKYISFNTRLRNSILPIGKEDWERINTYNSSNKGKYNSVISFTINYNI